MNQGGFSLAELLVVGIIATVLTGIVYAVFQSSQASLVAASHQVRLQQIASALSDAIQNQGHNQGLATLPVSAGNPCTGGFGPSRGLILVQEDAADCNVKQSTWIGFAVSDEGLLLEKDPDRTWAQLLADPLNFTSGWQPFKFGDDSVYVTRATPFRIGQDRRYFTVDLGKIYLGGNNPDSLAIPLFRVRCQYRW